MRRFPTHVVTLAGFFAFTGLCSHYAFGDSAILRWLEDLPGGGSNGYARSISANGCIVVDSSGGEIGEEATLWSDSTGIVGLDYLSTLGSPPQSEALGISADGSTVVGHSKIHGGGQAGAFRRTEADGMVYIGGGEAVDVSNDGLISSGFIGISCPC